MIKGFGIFSFLVFLILCFQIGEFGPGFAVWFLSLLLIVSGVIAYAFFLLPKSFEYGGIQKLKNFAKIDPLALVKTIHEVASVVRKDGLLATESLRRDLKDPWLQYSLKKMIDGFDKNAIIPAIRNEHLRFHEQFLTLEIYKERVTSSIALFGLAGSLSHLMRFLAKDDTILIAASFVPFLFALLIQLSVSAWIQNKIDFMLDQSRLYYALLESGVAGIQDGLNADVLQDQLMARLNQKVSQQAGHA